jgi:3'-phosphoadenosine 5'-phosphosulfate sulfotransferase (PAPS reductase)/FAD synthetase
MALRLAELGQKFRLLYTSTGNELPEVQAHILAVAEEVQADFVSLEAPTLESLIQEQECLPNWRMRWCTRMIKIEPAAEWLREHPKAVLAIGLRADEEGRAGGTYEGTECVYPLRDWGWGLKEVRDYCRERGFTPPKRTDCAVCFFQTLHEWYTLWSLYPEEYEHGERWEKMTGHTFRSPQRDSKPAALKDLRRLFEKGYVPKPRQRRTGCRVCSM